MPSLPSKDIKIFGGSLIAGNNIAVFGSLAQGATAYSLDPDVIQSSEWLQGIAACLVGNRSPAIQDLNATLYVATYGLAYLMNSGVPEWTSTRVYYKWQLARVPNTPFIAVSLSDNNTGNNPAADSTNWSLTTVNASVAAATVGNQNITVDGAGHLISFGAATLNDNGYYNTSSSRFTAPVKGAYRVCANVQVDNVSANAALIEFSLRAVINGGTIGIAAGTSGVNPPGGRWYPKIPGSVIVLNAGDTVEIQLEATDGVGTNQVRVSNSDWNISKA